MKITIFQRPDEESEFILTERDASLEITVDWKREGEGDGELKSTNYKIHTKAIPSNQTIITDVEPTGTTGTGTVKIRVKASFESLDSIISQKKLSLSEIEEQLAAIKVEMKRGGSSQTNTKGNASKQATPKKKKATIQEDRDDADTKLSTFQSTMNIAQKVGMTAIAGAFEFRAILMFGISVVAISMYGDRLSV